MLVWGFEGHSDTVMYYWPSSRSAFIVGLFVLLPSLSQPNAHPFFAINFLEAAFCGGWNIHDIFNFVRCALHFERVYRPLFVFCQILFERPCPLTAFERGHGSDKRPLQIRPPQCTAVWQTENPQSPCGRHHTCHNIRREPMQCGRQHPDPNHAMQCGRHRIHTVHVAENQTYHIDATNARPNTL